MMNNKKPSQNSMLVTLSENGLTPNEACLYLTMLECGEANPATLSKHSGIKRPTTYLILDALIEKGIVTSVKRGRGQQYRALDPSIICDKQDQAVQRLRTQLPSIAALTRTYPNSAEMRVFEGVSGLRQIMEDSLSSRHEILCWADVELVTQKIFKRYWSEYIHKRIKANIFVRAIFVSDQTAIEFRRRDKAELRESVLIPKARFPLQGEMNIYNDKIAILSYSDQIGVIVQNKTLADMQRSIFNLSFNMAKMVSGQEQLNSRKT